MSPRLQKLTRGIPLRDTVQAYVIDQAKFRAAFDTASVIKKHLLTVLKKLQDQGSVERSEIDQARSILKKKTISTLDKPYYSEPAEQVTDLQVKWQNIQEAIEVCNQLETESGLTKQDAQDTLQKISKYLDCVKVISRGVQRKEVTGWEMDVAQRKMDHHVLGPVQRTVDHQIVAMCKRLMGRDLLPAPFEGLDVEKLSYDQAVEFAHSKKDLFFKNIFSNVLSCRSLKGVDKVFEKYRTGQKYVELIKAVSENVSDPADQPDLETIGEWQNAVDELYHAIQGALKEAKTNYTEIQLLSFDSDICGFGVKAQQLQIIKDSLFLDQWKPYYDKSQEATKKLNNLKAKIDQETNKASEIKLELRSKQSLEAPSFEQALKTFQAVERLNFIESSGPEAIRELAGAKKEFADAKNKLGEIQVDLRLLDAACATYDLLVRAQEMGIPCFIHEGPKEGD